MTGALVPYTDRGPNSSKGSRGILRKPGKMGVIIGLQALRRLLLLRHDRQYPRPLPPLSGLLLPHLRHHDARHLVICGAQALPLLVTFGGANALATVVDGWPFGGLAIDRDWMNCSACAGTTAGAMAESTGTVGGLGAIALIGAVVVAWVGVTRDGRME
ncbi:hypothetical protein B0H10DRAFT_1954942 [Mycena sp. CBHHK59/15]|nr:hypothetical protein B0H10DRAFT_1954942 [Mycena sp. CBHHK59/15]